MTETTERIVLASRPVGEPTLDNFRLEEHPISQPGSGQMLLRTLWLSLDPYMRGRMSDAPSYAKPVGIGEVMLWGFHARYLHLGWRGTDQISRRRGSGAQERAAGPNWAIAWRELRQTLGARCAPVFMTCWPC